MSRDGGAVDVDIEDGKEHRDAQPPTQLEIRLVHFLHADDETIRGRDDEARVGRHRPFRIAEEVEDKERKPQLQDEDRHRHDPPRGPHDGGDDKKHRHEEEGKNKTQRFLAGGRHTSGTLTQALGRWLARF